MFKSRESSLKSTPSKLGSILQLIFYCLINLYVCLELKLNTFKK